jgi:hypothetical protein
METTPPEQHVCRVVQHELPHGMEHTPPELLPLLLEGPLLDPLLLDPPLLDVAPELLPDDEPASLLPPPPST